MASRTQYWATLGPELLAGELRTKIKAYYDTAEKDGRTKLWARATRLYYGLDADGGWARSNAVTYGGEQGELVQLRINHFRAFVQHVHTLVAGERPAVQTRAANAGHEAEEKALFARYLLDQFYRGGLEDSMRQASLYALYHGEGHLLTIWDRFKGEPHAVDEDGRVVHTGDVHNVPLRPCDVIRDASYFAQGDDDHPWKMTRRRVSRWRLVARYPQHAEYLKDVSSHSDGSWDRFQKQTPDFGQNNDDWVYQYDFFHQRDESMPKGRWCVLVGDKVIDDQELPSDVIPVLPILPEKEEDTAFGFSGMFDLMGPQEAYDSFITTMLSAHDASGLPVFWSRTGDRVKLKELAGGLRHIQTEEPPQVLSFAGISEHSYRLEEKFQGIFENLTGINSTVRGNPPANLESGSALALLDAKAIQFQSGYQGAWVRLVEKSGRHLLDLLRRHVTVERAATISAEFGITVAQYWTGKDLEMVDDVIVESANPAMNTVQGRMSIADKWAELKWIRSPEQYAQVIATGRAEPVYKRDHDEIRLIREENQLLLQGQRVSVAPTDRHTTHINEHVAGCLTNVHRRQDPNAMGPVIQHIQEHLSAIREGDPLLLAIVGDPMAQLVMQSAAAAPPAPSAAPQELSPQEGEQSQMPELPDMPVNPQTGEKAPSPNGDNR